MHRPDRNLYDTLHLYGPKKDFNYRIDAIERAINAGVKEVNIGPLIGLNKNWDFDVYMTLMHADYLQRCYRDVEVSVSYPRIHNTDGFNFYRLKDKDYLKIIFLTRLFLKRAGLNISTRESRFIRDNLIGPGITKMSAGSKTSVGGYYRNKNISSRQFDIVDERSVEDIIKVMKIKGYQPEFTNWVRL